MIATSFTDISQNAGIDYRGISYGAAWSDFNNDGFIDLWVGNHGPTGTLYQNQGDGTFIDVTVDIFEVVPQGDQHGAAWADFDNDGDRDLFVSIGGESGTSSLEDPALANKFYINERGTLVDRAIDWGLGYIGSRSRNPLWFDYNNDGRLDLFQGAGERSDGRVPATIFRQGDNGFEDLRPSFNFDLASNSFGILSDLVGDNTPELILQNSFEGISIYDSNRLTNITDSLLNSRPRGQDLISEDFNGDLLPDLYVTRRGLNNSAFFSKTPRSLNLNLLARENHQGIKFQTNSEITIDLFTFGFAFSEIEPESIFIGASGLNPVDLGMKLGADNQITTRLQLTLNPDDSRTEGLAPFISGEDEGVYIGYNPQLEEWSISLSTPDQDLVAAIVESQENISQPTAIDFNNDLQPAPDLLLLNDGSQLIDSTADSGLNSVRTAGINSVAGDFDNDMDLDIYIVTANAAGNEPNVLYDNQGDGTFIAVKDASGAAGSNLGIGDSVTTTDYNNDGFLDLFVTNGGFPPLLNEEGPYQLLKNEGNNNHWLQINLEGKKSNRDGIGSKVYVTAGGITQLRQQSGGIHDKTQNDSRLHFGLAENNLIEEIRVEWSSGTVQTLENVEVDRILSITESNKPSEGDDFIVGTDNNDTISGLAGTDTIEGGLGEDLLIGGDDNDYLRGDACNDRLYGNLGRDFLNGGDGADYLAGNDGDDSLAGEGGDDTLNGGANNDSLSGGDGNDKIFGFEDDDYIDGNAGNDTLLGNIGDDRLEGNSDKDRLYGNLGRDLLNGGDGADYLAGNDGDDSLAGEGGDDTLNGGADNDSLSGGDGNDKIFGMQGNDILTGDAGDDILVGGAGNDIFLLQLVTNRDIITDFSDGDLLGLSSGMTLSDLNVVARGNNTQIVDLNKNVLALLQNVDSNSIAIDDFITVETYKT